MDSNAEGRPVFVVVAASAFAAACAGGVPEIPNPTEGGSYDFNEVIGSGDGDSGSIGSGSSSGGGPTSAITCRTSAACLPGQVCCGAVNMTSSCQAGPCPTTMLGQLQLCGVSAECLSAADTCGPLAIDPSLGVMVCNGPSDGGTTDEGGIGEDGPSSNGDDGSDTGSTDAPTGG